MNNVQAVIVPGGQQTFIQSDGALAYTQAHSAFEPNFVSADTRAFDGAVRGGYFGPGGVGWTACPVLNSDTTTPTANSTTASGGSIVWQVFAQLPGLAFGAECIGFEALVHNVPQGTFGAWQYT